MATQDHFIEGLNKMAKVIQDEKLIRQEVECKSWFMDKIKKRYYAGCSEIKFPMQFSDAGTISMGECLPEDPWKGSYDLGTCSKLGKISGSLCLDEETLRCYGKINKESYIGLIGDDLRRMSERMVRMVDNLLVNDGTVTQVIANPVAVDGNPAGTLTAGDSLSQGCIFVRCPEEFQRGHQYEISSEGLPTPLKVYVTSIDCNAYSVCFQTNPVDGTAAVPAVLAPYDTAVETIYIRPCGFSEQAACGNMFGSINDCLFNGDTHFGIDRNLSPMLQGQEYDISETITAATALTDLYKIMYRIQERCGSNEMEFMVPYRLFRVLAQELQHSKDYENRDEKAFYGYTSICLLGPAGRIKITAVPKMPEDEIKFLDFSSFMWFGDSSVKDPEGPGSSQPAWHRERKCGYIYFRDVFFRGKLICTAPKKSGRIKIGLNYDNCQGFSN